MSSSQADVQLRRPLRAHQPVHRDRGPAERLRARTAIDRAARRAARAAVPRRPGSRRGDRALGQRLHAARSASPGIRTGDGIWSVRASYGLFYDQFQNGAGTASQVAISATPVGAVQPVQRRRPELPEPVPGPPDPGRRTPSSGRRRSSRSTRTRSRRPCRTGTSAFSARSSVATSSKRATSERRARHLPRNVEANPAVCGPGATAQNADRRRIYANCPADGAPATSRRSRCCATSRRRPTTPASSACRADSARASASTCPTGCRRRRTTCRR